MRATRNLIALTAIGLGLCLVGCSEDSDGGTSTEDAGSDDDAADDDSADDDTGEADDDVTGEDAGSDDDSADDSDDDGDDDSADDDSDHRVDAGADDDAVDAGSDDDSADDIDAGSDDDEGDDDTAADDDVEVDAGDDDAPIGADSGTNEPAEPIDSGAEEPADPAVAKFCNSLTRGDYDTTLQLVVGEGDDAVTFTATTGECVPADGLACTEVPVGDNVLVELFDTDGNYLLDSGTALLEAGGEYAFYTELSEDYPVWSGAILDQDLTCAEFNYDSF